jgi:hypothetical protein
MRSFEKIMLEAEKRVDLKTSLRARGIVFKEDATTAELTELRKNAPFDARFDGM